MFEVTRLFYRFAAIHSLLIGLLPFFIPIILWQQGYKIIEISTFIAITGVGFIFALLYWKSLYNRQHWRMIIFVSFVAELALILSLLTGDYLLEKNLVIFILMALTNGFYNCFYWVTQRTLFSAMTQHLTCDKNNTSSPIIKKSTTGKQFGNFQIVIVIFLKVGILVGGYFIAQQQTLLLLILTVIISVVAYHLIIKKITVISKAFSPINDAPKLNWRQKGVFIIDGVFLFCESYFWVLTLYYITDNNVMELGLLVVGLTLILSLIFWGIKNTIDRINQRYLFYSAIILYAISWGIRGTINQQTDNYVLMTSIIMIAFLTSFFRLSFNKQFFDDANTQNPLAFIISKSYLSQGGLAIIFTLLSALLLLMGEPDNMLPLIYWCLAPLALLYGAYPLLSKKHFRSGSLYE